MTRKSRIASAVRMALLASSAASLAFTSQAFAAEETEDDEDEEKITVTGSRIKRSGVDTFYPAISITAEDLENRAFTNVADALNEISTFGNADATPFGAQNNFSVGQNFVDFLGLGAQRTLTLIDGKRFVSQNVPNLFGETGGLQVDFNVIPVSLVETVEIIGVGGAPTYGSDAIAGTINVILKDDFEGLDIIMQTGGAEEGDANSDLVTVVGGANFSDGRGNVTFSAEHFQQEGLFRNARPFYTANDYQFIDNGAGTQTSEVYFNRRINIFTNGGLISPGRVVAPSLGIGALGDGNFYQFNSASELVPFTPGQADPASFFFALGGDGPDFFDNVAQIQSPLERQVFTSRMTFDLTDSTTFKSDFLYSNSSAVELVNQGGFQTFAFGGSSSQLVIPADHPLLSSQAQGLLAANGLTEFNLHRFNNDIIDSSSFREQHVWRYTASLLGDVVIGGNDFYWDFSFVHGRTDAETVNNQIIDDRFLNALDVRRLTQADVDAAGGEQAILGLSGTTSAQAGDVVCESVYQAALGNITGSTGSGITDLDLPFVQGCVPLNVFGAGAASPEALAWVTGDAITATDIEQSVYTANFGGDAFELPGGMAAFNIGYEKRQEQAIFAPGLGAEVPLTRVSPFGVTGGRYTTNEIYGEIALPILSADNDVFLAKELEVSLSTREIDNDLAGDFNAYTYGFRWAPIDELTFRANFTRSLRAPSLAELFAPRTQSFSTAADPCDNRNVGLGPNPDVRRANCAADIANYDPDNFVSNIVNATAIGASGGNPNLVNETADTWSWGFTWEPEYVENLLVTFDMFSIDLADAIQSLGLTTLMQGCYDNASFPNVPSCNSFTRDDTGQVVDFLTGQTNAASFRYRSADLFARYFFDVEDWGRFTITSRTTHLMHRTVSVNNEAAFNNIGTFGDPKNSGTFDVAWDKDDFRIFWRVLWQEGADLDPQFQRTFVLPNGDNLTATGSRMLHNVSASYILPADYNLGAEEAVVQLTVNNLFEREPGFGQFAAGHFGTAELLGRTFNLRLRLSF